ncbi:hypothetical protein CKO35_09775 [Ectothiorhodospira shaposhnikovii]|uniref:hypothetical protein n=1 Tax=Ectothiorhodospira shaposhnikovii TaxID=1054 RepID=UPI001907D93C|nr:hypothetical protein [Ectothiorhodospira shaposhnikovii]MBK1673590.1 hypothetical protein [Ectothiorhodospira shaposhnikovii]
MQRKLRSILILALPATLIAGEVPVVPPAAIVTPPPTNIIVPTIVPPVAPPTTPGMGTPAEGGIIPGAITGFNVQSMTAVELTQALSLIDQALENLQLSAVDRDAMQNLRQLIEQELTNR